MSISLIPATIYFVGIAAVVAPPPDSSVSRAVIFPEASYGTYNGVQLMPHEATLNLRKVDLPAAPADFCDRIGGKYDSGGTICRVTLHGARLWTRTTQALAEDSNFRKAPTFLNYNRNAKNLPDWYSKTDPKYVAARFDITGGTLSGCNRVSQFIFTLNTTSEIELFLEQNDRTVRIVLPAAAYVAIENKPLHAMTSSTSTDPNAQMSHFGWYYAMNGRYLSSVANSLTGTSTSLDPIVAPKTAVVGPKPCESQMPVDSTFFTGTAIASAECSAVFYP